MNASHTCIAIDGGRRRTRLHEEARIAENSNKCMRAKTINLFGNKQAYLAEMPSGKRAVHSQISSVNVGNGCGERVRAFDHAWLGGTRST
jgi:hypothetical protein